MTQKLPFSIWFTIILLAAFAVGYYAWSESLEEPNYEAGIMNYGGLSSKSVDSEMANWQTYRNTEYGFEFRYPRDWREIGKYKTEPAIPSIFDTGFADPQDQFRALRIFVFQEGTISFDFDINSGQVINFPGGQGNKVTWRNDQQFVTKKNNYIIQLWYYGDADNKSENERFEQILSTFRFVE